MDIHMALHICVYIFDYVLYHHEYLLNAIIRYWDYGMDQNNIIKGWNVTRHANLSVEWHHNEFIRMWYIWNIIRATHCLRKVKKLCLVRNQSNIDLMHSPLRSRRWCWTMKSQLFWCHLNWSPGSWYSLSSKLRITHEFIHTIKTSAWIWHTK